MDRKYRLYVDEVGNPDLNASSDPNHRYLCVAGVAIDLEVVRTTLAPDLEEIKADFFGSHPDFPVILHRKELVNKAGPFSSLADATVEARFNREFLGLLATTEYTVFVAIIDKLEHRERYRQWRYDPYHYCQEVLIERYAIWLKRRGAVGDVLAESRGRREDMRLKQAFARICEKGTDYVEPKVLSERLTSGELKLKNKASNIAGLQLADVIAHPCFRASVADRTGVPRPVNFGTKIAKIVEVSKYHRSAQGKIEGYGIKWLP